MVRNVYTLAEFHSQHPWEEGGHCVGCWVAFTGLGSVTLEADNGVSQR